MNINERYRYNSDEEEWLKKIKISHQAPPSSGVFCLWDSGRLSPKRSKTISWRVCYLKLERILNRKSPRSYYQSLVSGII